jgi:hypothetical protein
MLLYLALAVGIAISSAAAVWPLAKQSGIASQQELIKQANEEKDKARTEATKAIEQFNTYKEQQAKMLVAAEAEAMRARDAARKSEATHLTSVNDLMSKYSEAVKTIRTCTLSPVGTSTIRSLIQEANK